MGEAERKPNEVLMEKDGWCIERSWTTPSTGTLRPAWWHDNNKSFITHRCPGNWTVNAVDAVYVWNKDECCPCCQAKVPEEIKGLWIMHNWEELQHEG